LLHWKGLHLGLRAFAEAKLPDAEYWILGEGPEEQRLQMLCRDLKIDHQVKFLGHMRREEVLAKLGDSSVLVHPSLHDSGGLVCLEAMAAGRPVICLDLGGPAEQVTPETGFPVLADSPEQSVADMTKAMVLMAKDVDLRLKLGQAGQNRVRELFSWDAKGKLFTQLYHELTSSHPTVTKV
jgi:glycosyltransferase involved in cell wall biosynthesis